MAKSESAVDKEAGLACSQQYKCVLFRNNVGAFKDKGGQWVRYGIANESAAMNKHTKSSDRIGWTPVVITQEMVGKEIAVFTAIEMKKEGYKPSGKAQVEHYEAQQKFCNSVSRAFGIAGIADSAKAALAIIENYIKELKR